jgi:hypothetical protein
VEVAQEVFPESGRDVAGALAAATPTGKGLKVLAEVLDAGKKTKKVLKRVHVNESGAIGPRLFGKAKVRDVHGLPKTAKLYTTDEALTDIVFPSLERYQGISPHLASERLHAIKEANGRGGADNVVVHISGDVYSPETGELLGSLTQGGAKRE